MSLLAVSYNFQQGAVSKPLKVMETQYFVVCHVPRLCFGELHLCVGQYSIVVISKPSLQLTYFGDRLSKTSEVAEYKSLKCTIQCVCIHSANVVAYSTLF